MYLDLLVSIFMAGVEALRDIWTSKAKQEITRSCEIEATITVCPAAGTHYRLWRSTSRQTSFPAPSASAAAPWKLVRAPRRSPFNPSPAALRRRNSRAPPPMSAIATSQALYVTLQGQQEQRGAGAPSSKRQRCQQELPEIPIFRPV